MAVAQQQSPSNAKWIAAAAPVAGIVITWFGLPGFAATLVLLVAAGYSAHPALFTGKKDSRGYPTPAQAGERRGMQRYRMWQELRAWPVIEAIFTLPIFILLLSLTYFASIMMVILGARPSAQQWQKALTWAKEHTLPLHGSDSLLIGTRLWSFAAAGLALAFLSFPLERADAWRWVNTVSLYISIMQVNGAMRHNASEHRPSPGANLRGMLAPERRRQTGGAIIGGLVAAAAVFLTTVVVIRKAQVAYLIWPAVPWQPAVCLALAAGASVVALAVRNDALAEWREFVRVAEEWLPRWETMKMDGVPRLLGHKTVGMATVDTFTAPPMPGALGIMAMVPQLQQVMGIPVTIAGLASPNLDTQGQDMPGTRHPSKFRIATWPNDQAPNIADPTTEKDIVDLWVESSLSLFCESTGYGRTALLSCDPVFETPEPQMPTASDDEEHSFDEDDEPSMDLAEFNPDMAAEAPTTTAAYAVTISMPEGGDALGSLLRPVVGEIAGFMKTEVTIDHRQRVMFVGSLTEGTTNFAPPSLEKDIDNMTNEDLWSRRWSEILKKDANPPRPEAGAHTVVTLADQAKITRESFVVRHGEDPLEFFKLESKIATALDGARFVSVTGFTVAGNRPGERHPLGFSVAYSMDSIASNPDQLTPIPGNGPKFVLAGRINEAFDECRFARPEVSAVRALTDSRSRGHIWEIRLRLYGGATLADVRMKAEKIRQHLGSAWLRVDAAADGCSIFAGANPETVIFDSGRSSRGNGRVGLRDRDSSRIPAGDSAVEKKNRDTIIRLDWEQAFLDAGVVTLAGLLPTLAKASVLPQNEQVKDLEFDIPSGLDRNRVKGALSKLQASTGNAFVEVRPSSSATKFRLLTAVDSPLPRQAAFNFDAAKEFALQGSVAFATGVEGTPCMFDPRRDPHILIAGATGGGKSVILQNLLYAALISHADVYLMDATKAGADFSFAEPYTKAFCGTVKESAVAIKAIYQEVRARVALNKQHNVGSYRDLPEEVRPNHIYVFIDEFTSLMQPDPVDKTPSDDPEVEAERQDGLDLNNSRRYIGTITGKIAREARSAGVTLVLATQKLSAKMLDDIPGAGDLKTNLARALMGNATFGERQSALKNPIEAPSLGDDVPKGRGLWESTSGYAELIQVWFEGSQDVFASHLEELLEPLDDADKLSIMVAPPSTLTVSSVAGVFGDTAVEDEVVDLGEVSFSLDDLEVDIDEDDDDLPWLRPAAPAVEPEEEPPWAHAPIRPTPDRASDVPANTARLPVKASVLGATTIRFRTADGVSTVTLADPGTTEYGFWKLDAIAKWLGHADSILQAAWVDSDTDLIDAVGIPVAETARDLFADFAVDAVIASSSTDAQLDAFFAEPDAPDMTEPPATVPALQEDVFIATPPVQRVRPLLVAEDEF